MKMSELILQLQKIDETLPFDAEVVTGCDWQPAALRRVYHEPPYTFLEFSEDGKDHHAEEPAALFDPQQRALVEAYLSAILDQRGTEPDSARPVNQILGLIEMVQALPPDEVIDRLRALA